MRSVWRYFCIMPKRVVAKSFMLGAAHCTQAPTRRGLSSVSSPLQLRKQKCSGDPNGILPFLVVPEQPGQEEEEESKMANDGYEARK